MQNRKQTFLWLSLFLVVVLSTILLGGCGTDAGQKSEAPLPTATAEPSKALPALQDDDPAVFTVPMLEKWVRQTLNKSDSDPISVKELDSITEIYFAGSKAITADDYVEHNEFPFGGVQVGNERLMGWDFYSLADFRQFRNLTRLTVAGQQVTDLTGIEDLPLEYLNLTYNHVSDLSPLSGIKTLRSLVLAQNPVDDLTAVSKIAQLEELDLNRTNVSDLSALAANQQLRNLSVGYCGYLTDLSPLSKISSLSNLSLRGKEFDLSPLQNCKNLEYLTVSFLTQDDVEYLKSLTQLLFMEIHATQPEDLTLLDIPWLQELQLADCGFTSLSFLQNCTHLRNLYILRVPLETLDIPQTLPLETLELIGCNITDVSSLGSFANLQTVTIPEMAQESYDQIASQISWTPNFSGGGYEAYTPNPIVPQSAETFPKPCEAALMEPEYVPIADATEYNHDIITDELLNAPSTLPEASNTSLPYWTGFTSESKGRTTHDFIAATYWFEDELRFVSENGFNFYRAFYDFSNLSDPGDSQNVNIHALEEIDQLIAWGMKYNVHIQISLGGLPGYYGTEDGAISNNGTTYFLENPDEQALLQQYWMLLAARYAGISNKYLDFELMAEPNYSGSMELDAACNVYDKAMTNIIQGIWHAEGDKDEQSRRIAMVMLPNSSTDSKHIAALASQGCVVTLHSGGPHWLAAGGAGTVGLGVYENQSYLPPLDTVTWPVLFLPEVMVPTKDYAPLTITSESEFPAGTVFDFHFFTGCAGTITATADGTKIGQIAQPDGWTKEGRASYPVTLDNAASSVVFTVSNYEMDLSLIAIEIPGKDTIYLVPHSFFRDNSIYTDMPAITIQDDGTVTGKQYDAQAVLTYDINPFKDAVLAAGGGFMLTELQNGAWTPLSLVTQIDSDLYSAMQQEQIPWSGACLWDVLEFVVRPGTTVAPFEGTSWFYDKDYIDVVKQYAANAAQ